MTPLQQILVAYRTSPQCEREKGSYFEELIRTFEKTGRDLAQWHLNYETMAPHDAVLTVSLDTNRSVAGLPKFEID